MKLQILSDLHLESCAFTLKTHPEADAVVLAGDIAAWPSRARMENLIKSCPKPVIYIPGNHEGYKASHDHVWQNGEYLNKKYAWFRDLSHYPHYYADPAHSDVVIIGCTLWTNFSLPFWSDGRKVQDIGKAQRVAAEGINDFSGLIKGFSVGECVKQYDQSLHYLRHMLKRYEDKRVVVVTHFLPSEKSIDPAFATSQLNPYFATDLEWMMRDNPHIRLWIHGHTHHSCDYMVGETRVVCNPRGYRDTENPEFTSQFLVEV